MTRDPIRAAVLADRRRTRAALAYTIAAIRWDYASCSDLAGRVSPEERGARLALNEIERYWRETDRKARTRSKR